MGDTDVVDSIIKYNKMKMEMWKNYAQKENSTEESKSPTVQIRKSLKNLNRTCCPICGEQMSDERKPIAISPCGHTVCSSCLTDSMKYCPICNGLISNRAINFSVMQIAEEIIENKGDMPDYEQQFEETEQKIASLLEQLEKNDIQRKQLNEQERVSNAVIEHLSEELRTLHIKEKLLKEQLEEARTETQKQQEKYDEINEIVQNLHHKAEVEKLEKIIKEN